MEIIFYEKPGCAGNAKQKQLLDRNGISYTTKSILSNPWSKEELLSYFEGLSIEDIYNPFAPQIKSGEIKPQLLNKDGLVTLMLQEPILIKRPLLNIDGNKICGFDLEKINTLFGKDISSTTSLSTCQSDDPCKSA